MKRKSTQKNKGQSSKKGSVLVFITMIFVSMLTVLGVTAEVSSRAAVKSQAEATLELAGRSILSEYHLQLKQRYHLFGLECSEKEIEDKLLNYSTASFNSFVLSKGRLDEVKVSNGAFSLSDINNFEKQILNYMKYRIVLGEADSMIDFLKSAGSALETITTFDQEIEDEESNSIQIKADMQAEIDSRNDSAQREDGGGDSVSNAESEEILRQIQEGEKKQKMLKTLKQNAIDVFEEETDTDNKLMNQRVWKGLPSQCMDVKLTKPFGNAKELLSLFKDEGALKYLATNVYVDRYAFENFANKVNVGVEGSTFFQNEIEYILFGSPSDDENSRLVKKYLLILRTGLNTAHILADSEKRTQILEVANLLTPGPPAALTQLLIIAAWSTIEGINDIKNLENGNKVDFFKTKSNWCTNLENILEGNEDGYIPTNSERGLDYKGYLQLFLAVTDYETKLIRMMDLIQINMKGCYQEDFVFADCYTGFAIEGKIRKESIYEKIGIGETSVFMVHSYG